MPDSTPNPTPNGWTKQDYIHAAISILALLLASLNRYQLQNATGTQTTPSVAPGGGIDFNAIRQTLDQAEQIQKLLQPLTQPVTQPITTPTVIQPTPARASNVNPAATELDAARDSIRLVDDAIPELRADVDAIRKQLDVARHDLSDYLATQGSKPAITAPVRAVPAVIASTKLPRARINVLYATFPCAPCDQIKNAVGLKPGASMAVVSSGGQEFEFVFTSNKPAWAEDRYPQIWWESPKGTMSIKGAKPVTEIVRLWRASQ